MTKTKNYQRLVEIDLAFCKSNPTPDLTDLNWLAALEGKVIGDRIISWEAGYTDLSLNVDDSFPMYWFSYKWENNCIYTEENTRHEAWALSLLELAEKLQEEHS